MEQIIIISLAYALIGAVMVRPVLEVASKTIPAEFFERIKGGMVLVVLIIWPIFALASINGRISRWFKK